MLRASDARSVQLGCGARNWLSHPPPSQRPPSRLLQGWDQGVEGMCINEKRKRESSPTQFTPHPTRHALRWAQQLLQPCLTAPAAPCLNPTAQSTSPPCCSALQWSSPQSWATAHEVQAV